MKKKEQNIRKKIFGGVWNVSDGLGGGGGGVVYFFASNKRTESVYILLTEPSGYGLYGLFKKFFFENAVHTVQTTESSKESNIYSSRNKRCHYIFLSLHRRKDISGS